jgi:hypothetical protein
MSQETIDRRKQAFEKVRREIEDELEEEAMAEEMRRKERERQLEREQEMLQQLQRTKESHYKDGEPNQTIDKNLSKSGKLTFYGANAYNGLERKKN